MWIIPKTLSQSVLGLEPSTSDYAWLSQTLEQYVMWRGKHSPSIIWLKRLKREGWTQHLSGAMLEPLMAIHGIEKWIGSLEEYPVNRLVQQGGISESRTKGTSGLQQRGLYKRSNPNSYSLRTSQISGNTTGAPSEETFEQWDSRLKKDFSRRLKQVHTTYDGGFSFWHTPTTRDWKGYTGRQGESICNQLEIFGYSGKPNPRWLEWLMDVPIGWTKLDYSGMGWSQWLQDTQYTLSCMISLKGNNRTMIESPQSIGLSFHEWRSGQIEGIEWLQSSDWFKEESIDYSVRVIEAPTGTGKTGMILGLANEQSDKRFLIMCATKLEQDQYIRTLGRSDMDVVSARGKTNFHCALYTDEDSIDEEICNLSGCLKIHVDQASCQDPGTEPCEVKEEGLCPYFIQRDAARDARVLITNYSFGLSMMNISSDMLGEFDVIVCDEGHILDRELEKYIQVSLSRNVFETNFGFALPLGPTVRSRSTWMEYLKTTFSRMRKVAARLDKEYEDMEGRKPEEIKKLVQQSDTVERYIDWMEQIDNILKSKQWVIEDNGGTIDFKPIWVTEESQNVLFNKAPRFIIMSGTIPSPTELTKKVGVDARQFEFKRLPYTFEVENRPVIGLNPGIGLSHKVIDENLPQMVRLLDETIDKHPDVNILVHTVTYKIARYIMDNSDYRLEMMTHDGRNRIDKLNDFKVLGQMNSDNEWGRAIMVSPSFDKAVDLPNNECRVVIVCKLPYPYLGSTVMKSRVNQSKTYYTHETLMTLIQMIGRHIRSETDWGITYVLDAGFKSFLKRANGMIPQPIDEAIRFEDKKEVILSTFRI